MFYRRSILALVFLLAPLLAWASKGESAEDSIVHGTIDVAMGNKNGLVVLTDSMLTKGNKQLERPGQKLFKLDDRTVCAIAGFLSAPAPIPDFDTSISAILHEYVRQSAQKPPVAIADKLKAIAELFDLHLSTIANLHDAEGNRIRIDDFRLEFIIAGYDLDGQPKIGKARLGTKDNDGILASIVENTSIENVGERLTWKLSGMPDVAERLLSHPELGRGDADLNLYSTSLRKDGGTSLTVKQMVSLVKRLAFYTSRVHPEVGGPNQIAIFNDSKVVIIEQPVFPVAPKPIMQFTLAFYSTYIDDNDIAIYEEPEIFIRCAWERSALDIDKKYFVGNSFDNSLLMYRGGKFGLDNSNQVTNSALILGPLVDLNSEAIRRLSKAFPWRNIVWYAPIGTF